MLKMKIIIIGIGGMGISHLRSFVNSKKNYLINVVEIKKKKIQKVKKLFYKKKINFYSKIPSGDKFDLAIIATNSKERYNSFKNLIKKNQVKKIILEKFVFYKLEDYKNINKYYKNYKNKILVNTIGRYIFNSCLRKFKLKKKINMTIILPQGTLFTSMIHYIEFFYLIVKKEINFNFSNIKKIIPSKRIGYHEGIGQVIGECKNGKLKIFTKATNKVIINFEANGQIYKILFFKNKFNFYKNYKLKKTFLFPFASRYTEKHCFSNFYKLKNYYYISILSYKILKSLYEISNKIKIT